MDDFESPLVEARGLRRAGDDFTRDQWGTPHVACPTGATVRSGPRKGLPKMLRYGRPSGLNKQIEAAFQLARWNERQIIFGLTVPDDELTQRLVMLADLDRDSDAAKDTADAVVVRAKALAKSSLAADRGTHMHAVTEDVDLDRSWVDRAADGDALGLDPAVQAAMLDAWDRALVAYDLEVLAVERRIVHDGWRQAGTLDRIVRLTRDITFDTGEVLRAGSVVVLDVKTGKLNMQYWQGYAVQCAVYAGGVPYDVAEDRRFDWEWPIDQDRAIIAHLPVDEAMSGRATCRMILVDIASARRTIDEVIMPAKAWAQRRDLFAVAHSAEPAVSVAVAKIDRSVRHDFGVVATPAVDVRADLDEGDTISDEQLDEVKRRAGELPPQARALLDSLARDAKTAGVPLSMGAGPTRRRWHLYRAMLRIAAHFGDDLEADHLRATLALVVPDAGQPAVSLGAAIGSLSLAEAMRFVQAAVAVIEQQPAIQIADDGSPTWADVRLPAA